MDLLRFFLPLAARYLPLADFKGRTVTSRYNPKNNLLMAIADPRCSLKHQVCSVKWGLR